ncbi:MAG: hypothetical protein K6B40_06525 [Firmicutes bacterium]|nr:hypothetical protein [Bacillota bacterium]
MKKWLCLLLMAVTAFALCACGETRSMPEEDQWPSESAYEDENGNYLFISPAGGEGWMVDCTLGEDAYGNVLQLEDDTLHGNLIPEGEDGELIVTLSREGEEDVIMTVEGGDTYHFTPMAMPNAKIFVDINTEGMGQIEYAKAGKKLKFNDEFPVTSAQINLAKPETYTFGAQTTVEGWEFVKWTKNGEDFSTEPQFTVELTEDAKYVAVFESAN